MSDMPEQKSSSNNGGGPRRRGGATGLIGRRAKAQLGLLAALVVATVIAYFQEPKPNPFETVPDAFIERVGQNLRYPIERNPHMRLPVIPVSLSGVHFRNGVGWIVGAQGYIARSDDGGRTWVRSKIETVAPPAPAKTSALPGLSLSVAHAQEQTPPSPAQRPLPPPPPPPPAPRPFAQQQEPEKKDPPAKGAAKNVTAAVQPRSPVKAPTPVAPIIPPFDVTKADLRAIYFADANRGIAVGENGTVLLTVDSGRSWQARSSGTQASLLSVAHNGSRWVAVGSSGTILSSEDGNSWQARSSGTRALLQSVAHNGSRWVAVGHGVTLASDNGVDWKPIDYRRYFAAWYWLLCAGLLVAVPLTRRVREPELVHEAPQRSVADQAVTDAPVRSVAEDRLGFAVRVDGLSRYLRNSKTEPPLTLAINGKWGSGKSSFMRMLQADLERHGARTVWFNAWHLQKEEQLQAALLDAIRKHVPPPLWTPLGIVFRWRLFWKRTKAAPLMALGGTIAIVGVATYLVSAPKGKANTTHGAQMWTATKCLIAPPQESREDKLVVAAQELVVVAKQLAPKAAEKTSVPVRKDGGQSKAASQPEASAKAGDSKECVDVLKGATVGDDWWKTARKALINGDIGVGLLILLLGIFPIVKALATLRAFGVDPAALKATISGLTSRRALTEETSVRSRFTQEFAAVTEALVPRTLTIFVDDLDRCNEKQVMETLEAVNYLADSGRCYVVLGMWKDTVERLVGLAVEKLATELAEQTTAKKDGAALTPAQIDEAKREQRREFANKYLEKLVNISVDVPSVGRDQAAALIKPEPNGASQKSAANNGEPTHGREERSSGLWSPPRWVGWVDWLFTKARGMVFPAALLVAALFAVWFAREMAESGKQVEQKVPPSAAKPASQPDKQDPETSPSAGSTDPTRRPTVAVTLPDLAAPAPAAAGWMQWTVSALIAAVLFLAFYFVLLQPLDYNSHDSPAFSRALAQLSQLAAK